MELALIVLVTALFALLAIQGYFVRRSDPDN